jgi:hypothetical protein
MPKTTHWLFAGQRPRQQRKPFEWTGWYYTWWWQCATLLQILWKSVSFQSHLDNAGCIWSKSAQVPPSSWWSYPPHRTFVILRVFCYTTTASHWVRVGFVRSIRTHLYQTNGCHFFQITSKFFVRGCFAFNSRPVGSSRLYVLGIKSMFFEIHQRLTKRIM